MGLENSYNLQSLQPIQHKVEKGDTFGSIAKQYGIGIHDLKKLNPHIKNIHKIKKGSVINLVPMLNQDLPLVEDPDSVASYSPIAPLNYYTGELEKQQDSQFAGQCLDRFIHSI